MLNTLAKTPAKARFSKLSGALCDVDCKAWVDTSAETLAKAESYSHYNTLGYVQAKALMNTLVVALEEAKPKDLAAPRVMGRPRLETLGDLIKAVKAHAHFG